MRRLLDKLEAANWLNVSVRTIDRLRSEGRLRAIKVRGAVRFAESELQRYVDKQTKFKN